MDTEDIDSLISAELLGSEQGRELYYIVNKYNMHRHSPSCRWKTRNRQFRFGYDTIEINPEPFIDETCNRVFYRRRAQEDLKVVPYNFCLTRKYLFHINIEQTQGGEAEAYLMKYAFMLPSV